MTGIVVLIMFGCVALLVLGVPVAFAFGLATIAMALAAWPGASGLQFLALNTYSVITTDSLIAIPLFVFMAEIVTFSGLGSSVFGAMERLLGRLPGGLAVCSMTSCIGFASITGSSAANTATVGTVAVGEMLKRGYDKRLSCGSIAAGGAIGILIPPSVFMVVYGFLANVSVVSLFIAGVLPGLMLGGLFILYIMVRAIVDPRLAPRTMAFPSLAERLNAIGQTMPLLSLAAFMLGAIYAGIATPNEIAAVGAVAALGLAGVHGRLTVASVRGALLSSVTTTCMIFWIMIGTWSLGFILNYLGAGAKVADVALSVGPSAYSILIAISLLVFVLGMFLDPGAILMLVTPVVLPILQAADIDLVWFGIIFTLNMEMAMITPPFGINLFVMKGIAPAGVTMTDIAVGAAPFVLIEILAVGLVMAFPEIALWLPSQMVRVQ